MGAVVLAGGYQAAYVRRVRADWVAIEGAA